MCLSSPCPAGVGKDRDVFCMWETEAKRDGWPWAQLGRLGQGVLVGSWLNVSQWWTWVAKKEQEGGAASPLGETQSLLQRHSQKMRTPLRDGEGQAEDTECGQHGVGPRPLRSKEVHMEEGIAFFTVL